jgi:hypothetical protein
MCCMTGVTCQQWMVDGSESVGGYQACWGPGTGLHEMDSLVELQVHTQISVVFLNKNGSES